ARRLPPVLASRLSVLGSRLSFLGSRLSALGSRLSALKNRCFRKRRPRCPNLTHLCRKMPVPWPAPWALDEPAVGSAKDGLPAWNCILHPPPPPPPALFPLGPRVSLFRPPRVSAVADQGLFRRLRPRRRVSV